MALTFIRSASLTITGSISQADLQDSVWYLSATPSVIASFSQARLHYQALAESTGNASVTVSVSQANLEIARYSVAASPITVTASVSQGAMRRFWNLESTGNAVATATVTQALATKSKFQAYANTPIGTTVSVAQADLVEFNRTSASISAAISFVNTTASIRPAYRNLDKNLSPAATFTGFGYPYNVTVQQASNMDFGLAGALVLDAAESYDTTQIYAMQAFGGDVTFDAGCTAAAGSGYFAPADGQVLVNGARVTTRLSAVAVKAGSSGDLLIYPIP